MDDNKIIELFFSRSESAITETANKYGRYLRQIAFNILRSREDSEECTNDTYMKAWNVIPPQRPDYLKAFLGRITRNTALGLYEKYTAAKRSADRTAAALDELADCIPDTAQNPAKISEDNEIKACLNDFLAGLPEETRKIFVRRYWYMSSVHEIAAAYHFSESKVKMSLKRTRDRLKEFLRGEGIYI